MSGLITQQKMKTLKDNRPMPEPKISKVNQKECTCKFIEYKEELACPAHSAYTVENNCCEIHKGQPPPRMRKGDNALVYDDGIVVKVPKQDNTAKEMYEEAMDINSSDIRLRKDAVLQTAKQIFVVASDELEMEKDAIAEAKWCIKLAEIWHTAQEEYINEE